MIKVTKHANGSTSINLPPGQAYVLEEMLNMLDIDGFVIEDEGEKLEMKTLQTDIRAAIRDAFRY
jgi:hypothetical protein